MGNLFKQILAPLHTLKNRISLPVERKIILSHFPGLIAFALLPCIRSSLPSKPCDPPPYSTPNPLALPEIVTYEAVIVQADRWVEVTPEGFDGKSSVGRHRHFVHPPPVEEIGVEERSIAGDHHGAGETARDLHESDVIRIGVLAVIEAATTASYAL